MDFKQLFIMQRELDEHIEEEHPTQPGEKRLLKKLLALQVEIGELANEQRSWKFWSHDQKPRVKVLVEPNERNPNVFKNPLLEEYADGLSFILSIGNDLGYQDVYIFNNDLNSNSIAARFLDVMGNVSAVYHNLKYDEPCLDMYGMLLNRFLFLGNDLGFTREQIVEAYMAKNAINHQRLETGY